MTVLFLDANSTTRPGRSAALRQELGWEVVDVASVAEAKAWLGTAAVLDLLITEAIPDASSSGFELRDAALKRFPHAKVLFTTRYDLTGFEAQINGSPLLLDGPYSDEKLIAKARLALEEPDGLPVLTADPQP